MDLKMGGNYLWRRRLLFLKARWIKLLERLKYINRTKFGPACLVKNRKYFFFLFHIEWHVYLFFNKLSIFYPAEICSMKESSAWFLHFQWILQQRRRQKRVEKREVLEWNMETARKWTIQVGGSIQVDRTTTSTAFQSQTKNSSKPNTSPYHQFQFH